MATITILHEEDGTTSTVTVTLVTDILSDSLMTNNSWLLIKTTIKQINGTAFPFYIIKDLTDVAPGSGASTTFTSLINDWVDYFVNEAQLGYSSSSSSSSGGYSSSSSSSSSELYSESSSSSSSSELYSESSSSSSN